MALSSPGDPPSDTMPVNLTRVERAFLVELVNFYATAVGEGIEHARDLEALEAAIVRAQLQARLWRASVEGTLELDTEILDLVAKHRADCLRYVADEHAALGKLRGGNMDWCSIGMSPDESEHETLLGIDSALEEIHAACALLARIGDD